MKQVFRWFKGSRAQAAAKSLKEARRTEAPMITTVTTETFKEVILDRPGVVFVFCYAAWCKPCHKMAEIVEDVARDLPDVLFVKLDIDDAVETAVQYNISGTPTFLLFESGKLRASRFGSLSARKLKAWINEHAGQAD